MKEFSKMFHSFLLFLLAFVSFVQCALIKDYKSYKDYKLFQVQGQDGLRKLISDLKELDDTLAYSGNETLAHLLVKPELVPVFEKMTAFRNLNTQLLVDDYSRIIELEKLVALQRRGFSWNAYYDIDDIYGFLEKTARDNPDSTELIVGGQSYEGRKILGLRINSPTRGKQGKPVFFIESGIHAREWITPATTTYFINELLTNSDPDIAAMRDQFDWHIFPTVNPDGYHYSYRVDRMWRKTRSKSPNGCYGADPNRNWDYNWLKHGANDNPCDYQVYGGAHPFSEVETRTLSAYIAGLENLQAYVAFHADAQMLLLPYSDSVEHEYNYDDLVQIGNTSLAYGYKVNHEEYRGPATAAEILYKASGGSMDWVRHSLRTPIAYTYELRGVYFHWPPWKIHEQGDEVTQMMLGLVAEANNLGYF